MMAANEKEITRARRRSKKVGKGYGFRNIRQSYPTPRELKVLKVLRANRASFEFQPVVFAPNIRKHISPDFLVFSWRGKRLTPPRYVEIDGDRKNLADRYQKMREAALTYPLIRIWNSEVDEGNAEIALNFLLDTPLTPCD